MRGKRVGAEDRERGVKEMKTGMKTRGELDSLEVQANI